MTQRRGQLAHLNITADATPETVLNQPCAVLFLEAYSLNILDSWLQIFDKTPSQLAVSAVATHADGSKYTATAHGYVAGDKVVHEAFADSAYNGDVTVVTVVDANNYTTAATYTATGTGTSITKPKLAFLVPAGDGTVYGSNQIKFGKFALGQELICESSFVYAVTTTIGGKTSPASVCYVNAVYLPV